MIGFIVRTRITDNIKACTAATCFSLYFLGIGIKTPGEKRYVITKK
jgi:uncharacterized membrane protein YqgA involved in biofilm formation